MIICEKNTVSDLATLRPNTNQESDDLLRSKGCRTIVAVSSAILTDTFQYAQLYLYEIADVRFQNP